ncbi:hypothetical protein B6N60_02399 [Richelia sinica FACHB-800]|uniref:Uncharacterized protein n=1 Tax=Richelia sinica FACHB-800 TaxID=1357546 RepID=A0A975T7Z2_9NOST|nr:hypothetical protein [Richelia sinica]MBD2665229.1 hypothetical protein [Richelia sinica FACHB-800]QXE23709.1 hypothetical protein B6N60_02399 [Richelia sinica FACHB-800]
MADPVTLTAATIAGFAFSKFFESSVGKLGEKFTEAALAKMDELRKKIWDKLRGNNRAVTALTAIEQGSKADLDRLAVYLEDEMREDAAFAEEVQKLAQEIHAGKIQDNSQMVMNIDGQNNTGTQKQYNVAVEGGKSYIADSITIHEAT